MNALDKINKDLTKLHKTLKETQTLIDSTYVLKRTIIQRMIKEGVKICYCGSTESLYTNRGSWICSSCYDSERSHY